METSLSDESAMNNLLTSIEAALNNQLQERAFHLRQSKKTISPVSRGVLLRLAAEADEHYEALRAIHKELLTNGTWLKKVLPVINKTDIVKPLLKTDVAEKEVSAANRADLDALKSAVKFEKWGYDFYMGLSRNAEAASEKKLFELLASMKWEHLLSLKETMLFHENPAVWVLTHGNSHQHV
jgi:rubrerythrin